MHDVKTELEETTGSASTSERALGSLTALLVAALVISGCERGARAGSGGASRDVVVSTARLSPGMGSTNAAAAPSETLADVLLTSGSSAEPDRESGAPTPTCVQGWSAPPRGSSLRKAALDMMRSTPNELFLVDEIRYFVGPEDADVVERARDVERWYVKARTDGQPERQQRWLVRRAAAGSGIDAVAPYDSHGYGPGVWVRSDAVDPSFADPFQRPCDIARADARCMGLPREVLGCLSGT